MAASIAALRCDAVDTAYISAVASAFVNEPAFPMCAAPTPLPGSLHAQPTATVFASAGAS